MFSLIGEPFRNKFIHMIDHIEKCSKIEIVSRSFHGSKSFQIDRQIYVLESILQLMYSMCENLFENE